MNTRSISRPDGLVLLFVSALFLSHPAAVRAAEPKSNQQLAADAFRAHDYPHSARLFLAAAEEGSNAVGSYYNAACSFALAAKPDEAFAALEKAAAAGFEDITHAKADNDLAVLHGDPRWLPLLAKADARAKANREFWDGPALQTPYRENLSEDEKIAGLSKVWAEAKFNFIHFDQVPDLNWDALYMETLPKVRATESTFEYYRVLMAMVARLHDGHSGVWMPDELLDRNYGRPYLRTDLVEGKVVIVAVAEPLRAQGIAPGLEITEVDGVSVLEYARTRVMPYQPASTPQDRDARTYGRALLQGPANRPVVLALRDSTGSSRSVTVPRAPYTEWKRAFQAEPMSLKWLPGKVAYVALTSFDDDQAAVGFEAAFPEIAKAEALVLDVRENGGGNGGVGFRILGALTDQPFLNSKWETRDYRPSFRAWGQREGRYKGNADSIPPNGKLLFSKPVVVLTGPSTYSAAEDFSIVFQGMKRGRIVGEATGGSTGQPLSFPLPGGGGGRVCTKHDSAADGTEFVGVGIQPDVVVHPTIADLRAGRDTVLEAALRELGKG